MKSRSEERVDKQLAKGIESFYRELRSRVADFSHDEVRAEVNKRRLRAGRSFGRMALVCLKDSHDREAFAECVTYIALMAIADERRDASKTPATLKRRRGGNGKR
jgi:hypothetical protein